MFVARCGSARSSFRTRKRAASAGGVRDAPTIAIVVPFRDQPEQDRRAQLAKLQKHIAAFLSSPGDDQQGGGGAPTHFLVVVAEQTHDGCAFNRGALLNVGFLEAQKAIKTGRFASVILHDVDLLPSPGLLPWYRKAPQDGQPVHIAGPSTWRKYGMMGEYSDVFFGGVTALSPKAFAAANGYPNNYWGWGMEDDQLRMRVHASGGLADGVLRPPAGAGAYTDLDRIAMLDHLNTPDAIATHATKFNPLMFADGDARGKLDHDWAGANGLRGLRYLATSMHEGRLGECVELLHITVQLEQSDADRRRAAALSDAMQRRRPG